MKIYINRKPVAGPWGGGNNFVKALYEYLPRLGYEIVQNPYVEIPQVIYLQSPKNDNVCNFSINDALKIKSKYPNVSIILRVNECDARKGTKDVDSLWLECSKYIDKTIFVSHWIKNYFLEKAWACKNNHILYNGVDKAHFRNMNKINNGKVNIVTHHWSNNRMKGFDIYEKLDKFVGKNNNYTFTYIGRHLNTFKNTKILEPLFGKELGEALGVYDIYISGSKYDPGPNHILESLACSIPTFVCKDGGGSCEFAGKEYTYEDFDNFIDLIKIRKKQNSTIDIDDWMTTTHKFSKIINS